MSETIIDFEVKVGYVPGKINTIVLNGERTIAAALETAELDLQPGFSILLNGEEASLSTVITSTNGVVPRVYLTKIQKSN